MHPRTSPCANRLQLPIVIGLLVFGATGHVNAQPAPLPVEQATESTAQAPPDETIASETRTASQPASEQPVTEPEPPRVAPEPAPTVAELVPAEWAPHEVGQRWEYVYVRERTRSLEGQDPETEKLRGTLTNEIVAAAPQFGSDVVQMRSTLQGRTAESSGESVEERKAYFHSEGIAYQLVAEELSDPVAGRTDQTRYPEPLRLLETDVAVGHRWKVGVREEGGLKTDLEGEIMGVQDVQTPHGLFENCLVVRLEGDIVGVVEAYGARMEVPEGRYTATLWYAPGIGRVLAKEERRQKLVMDDGSTISYSERTQYALRATEGGMPDPVPANSEPAAN